MNYHQIKRLPPAIKQALAVQGIHSVGCAPKPLPAWATTPRASSLAIRNALKAEIGLIPDRIEHYDTASWDYEGLSAIMGKPRMTQRDRWAKRDCVLRYRDFADDLRDSVPPHIAERMAADGVVRLDWTAHIAMPESWSKKKRAAMDGRPHRQRPDRDNIDKAILDSLFTEDSGVSSGMITKVWAYKQKLSIVVYYAKQSAPVDDSELTH